MDDIRKEQEEQKEPSEETEEMEVHHHPKVEKKNFKEYLLEGLMIFVAVMLGFFAENIRENISNSRQVNEYMQSMVSDLKSDITMYDSAVAINLRYSRMVDTIFTVLKEDNPNTGKIYYLARRLTISNFVISLNGKTFLQMTSTGGLRLIRHQSIADSIASYYQQIKLFDYWADLQRQRVNDMITVNDKLFDASVFFSIYKAIENGDEQLFPRSNSPLLSKDPLVINAVLMRYQYFYGFLHLMDQRAAVASGQANRLLMLLKDEYQIKDE